MPLDSVSGSDFFLYLIIALIVVAYWTLRSAWFKGKVGESIVRSSLTNYLDQDLYYLINDVTLPFKGSTTQIDHIVLSPYGVFVIETKHMKGWIFGSPKQRQWTQVIYKHKQKFLNPIKQNQKHIAAVRELLNLNWKQVRGSVVFTGDCDFKTPMPIDVHDGVGELVDYIYEWDEVVCSDSELETYIETISAVRLEPGFKTNRIHIGNISEQHSPFHQQSPVSCPVCNGEMLKRTNKRSGEAFLGCKKFPICKGTRNISV